MRPQRNYWGDSRYDSSTHGSVAQEELNYLETYPLGGFWLIRWLFLVVCCVGLDLKTEEPYSFGKRIKLSKARGN
ncbi:hypothetical protein EUTSA_v10029462mg [Eutrema salsugineum]|uniref:Uncharacterized protein n=1 Tax=Eutrema salsugineum TaxID=72664 RepID=V4L520_EUTSA|nr:hypothetical protein EUTSA_v10029462mg [Eutrema salsugineum]